MKTLSGHLDQLIRLALDEDLRHGDVTSEATIPADAEGSAILLAKEDLTLSGRDVVDRVFLHVDERVALEWFANDGDTVSSRTTIARLRGPSRSLLSGERIALNFLQRLSGIATQTRRWVSLVGNSNVKLLDTRKTTPGWRTLEKNAVRHGGAHNHRFSLDSGVMIKDNHIRAAGSIALAVARARAHAPQLLQVEVEVTNFDELEQALNAGADVIMLDNMPPEAVRRAVETIAGRAISEASGGITNETLAAFAATGVDTISLGALTHSARAVDISMEFERG